MREILRSHRARKLTELGEVKGGTRQQIVQVMHRLFWKCFPANKMLKETDGAQCTQKSIDIRQAISNTTTPTEPIEEYLHSSQKMVSKKTVIKV
jgi:hypothetical protein